MQWNNELLWSRSNRTKSPFSESKDCLGKAIIETWAKLKRDEIGKDVCWCRNGAWKWAQMSLNHEDIQYATRNLQTVSWNHFSPHSCIGTSTVTVEHLRTKTLPGRHRISGSDPGTESKILGWPHAWMPLHKMYPCPMSKAFTWFRVGGEILLPQLCLTQWVPYSLGCIHTPHPPGRGSSPVGFFGVPLNSSESAKVKGV